MFIIRQQFYTTFFKTSMTIYRHARKCRMHTKMLGDAAEMWYVGETNFHLHNRHGLSWIKKSWNALQMLCCLVWHKDDTEGKHEGMG